MSSHSANQVAYNALEKINQTYAQDFMNISNDAKEIAHLNSNIEYDQDHETYYTWTTPPKGLPTQETVMDMTMYNQRINDQNEMPAAIKKYEQAVETLSSAMGSSQATDLNTTLGALNAVIGLNRSGTEENASVEFLSNDAERNALLTDLLKDIGKLIKADEDTQKINNLASLNAANNPNAAEVAKLAGHRNQDEAFINGNVGTLESLIQADKQTYTTTLDKAETAKDHHTTAQIWLAHFGLSFLDEKKDYTPIINHSKAMLQSLHSIAASIASLGSIGASTQLEQLQELIQVIITKVKEILGDKSLSTKEKADALLPLMMEMLGIYKMIRQDTETQKARNKADMEKAQTQASEAQIQQTKTNETMQSEIAKENAISKIAAECSKWVNLFVGVIMAGAASGLACLAILTLTILQFSGVTQKFENDIANDILAESQKDHHPLSKQASKILAALVMTGMEIGATLGVGLASDLAAETNLLMSIIARTTGDEATQAAINSAQEAITAATDAACTQAAATSTVVAEGREAAETTIKNIAEKAGKEAAKRMLSQMFKQNAVRMAKTFFRQTTRQALETTVKNAVISAIEKSTAAAADAASGTVVSEEVMTQIAKTAANQAVADATKKSVERITAEGDRSSLNLAGRRAGASAVYGIGSTNMLVDIATYCLSKDNKSNSTGAMILLATLGLIQGAMEMISMIAGGGFMNQASLGSSGSSIMALVQKSSAGMQTVNQGAQSAFAFAQASIDKTKAAVQYNEQINATLSSMVQGFLSNFIQDETEQRSAFNKEQAEETESQKLLVLNLQKGANEAIKVLTEQAV